MFSLIAYANIVKLGMFLKSFTSVLYQNLTLLWMPSWKTRFICLMRHSTATVQLVDYILKQLYWPPYSFAGRGVGLRGRGAFAGRGGGRGRSRGGGRGAGRGGGQGAGRGAGGGALTREQLDNQLDDYMSKTKGHLDAELDAYMAQAEDMEWMCVTDWPARGIPEMGYFLCWIMQNSPYHPLPSCLTDSELSFHWYFTAQLEW